MEKISNPEQCLSSRKQVVPPKTRKSLQEWIAHKSLRFDDYLFGSKIKTGFHLSTRQYARIVKKWISSIGLDITSYGTHTMRRTKVSLIYKKIKGLRVVRILIGHTKLESTVRYLGIEVDDALELSEATDILNDSSVIEKNEEFFSQEELYRYGLLTRPRAKLAIEVKNNFI